MIISIKREICYYREVITGCAYQAILFYEFRGLTFLFETRGGEVAANKAADRFEEWAFVQDFVRAPGRELLRLEHGEGVTLDKARHNVFKACFFKDFGLLLGTIVEVVVAAYDEILNTCLLEEGKSLLHLHFAHLG